MTMNASFIEDLVQLVPQLKPLYDEHLADNGTLLPHVFMGDVTRFVVAESGKSTSQLVLQRLLARLEEGLSGGPEEIQELIVVSFVENLTGQTVALRALTPLMGPNLKTEVETMFGT